MRGGWITVIALAGWLVLAVTAFRSYRAGLSKTVLMIVVWGALFLLVAAIFTAFGA